MSEITELKLWKDPGFTDGCVEVPAYANVDVLPEADLTLDDGLNPSKGRMFSEIKINRTYAEIQNMSYLRLTVSFNNDENDRVYFGFIDSVEIVSDTDDYPAVLVKWHVDLWRTYLNGAVFGFGVVTRRIQQTDDPPQRLTYRYRIPGEYTPMNYTGPGANLDWVVLTFTTENTNHKITECRTMVFPVNHTAPLTRHYLKIDGQTDSVLCPSLADVINGDFDEKFGISASTVSSVFISPYPPLAVARVEGTTIYLATSSVGSTTERVTVNINTLPTYVTNLNVYDRNYWSDVYFEWINSEGSSGTEHRTTERSCGEWLEANPGAVNDSDLNFKINGSRATFVWPVSANVFIRSCLGNQYTPANGDTFKISRCYHSATFQYPKNSNWNSASGSGTLATDFVFTYDGSSWVSSASNDTIIFDSVPACSYTFKQGGEAFSVNLEKTNPTNGYGFAYTGNGNYPEQTIAFTPLKTTDTKEWVFTDMNGSAIGSIPWGIELNSLNVRLIVNATSAFIEFRENIDSHTKGTAYTVPLPAVDVTSNSWSDYVYSGSRDADISNRRIASEQALTNGLIGSVSGGAQGAMMGGLKDIGFVGANKPKGVATLSSVAHAGAFGALGAGAGLASALGEYASAQYFNDRIQDVADIQNAKQFDSIILAGSGWDWLWHGRKCAFVSLVADNYSLTRFANNISLNGLSVSEPTADCTALIHGVGPLRIENLIVRGNIPAEAKQYIKQKINDGVRLI